ncbi:armadillo-type protein [Podospora didyma]|uniref:Armadillo-type protein n=1 Tax=Podospora didyma TaxID=330526 RepID=A0AAE0KFJ6_9PEZI|nr:armadillo-type protein [Podospora didyma]
MAAVAPSAQRTAFFQQLKPLCVPLSQLAIRSTDKAADAHEIRSLLESISRIWTAQVSRDASILDDRLADYVFFPVSHIVRSQAQYPVRVIEATIRLLGVLIQHGWKAKIPRQLSQQLLVFLAFIIGGDPAGQDKKREIPEETALESYRTLAALVAAVELSPLASPSPSPPPSSAEDGQTIPALGHSVTVMLDGVTGGTTPAIQLEALNCVRIVFTAVKDNSVLAQFLPGTVSAVSKVLSLPLQRRTQNRVLVACLEALKLILINVLGDLKVRTLLKQREVLRELEPLGTLKEPEGTGTTEQYLASQEAPGDKDAKYRVAMTPAWLKATSSQVKIALSSVLRLRNHDSEDVQSALGRLCISLLDECHSSLSECQSILVETAMMLEDESTKSTLETSLQDLAGVFPELGDSIKLGLYNWITGLPRVMQSSDERVKQLAIRNILRGIKLAAALQMDSSTLNDSLGDALRDSIAALIRNSKPSRMLDDVGAIGDSIMLANANMVVGPHTELTELYRPVLFDLESQKTTRDEINTLIANIGSAEQQTKLATAMLGYLRDSDGVDQIASYWLVFELLKSTYGCSSDVDDMMDLSSLDETKYQDAAFQELYEFSASVLSSHSDSLDETDWRLEATALEVTAFAASRMKSDFRPELIDVLYPITTFLGSQVPQLRRHAITTLNMMAASCGYESVPELIVDNADYMVNSVSLRLNTFDISPSSIKVLTMMVRLTGPKLIPFLDDVVAAIFAALDNFHGYPAFVESLFSVLSEVVTQGVKSDMLLLEDSTTKPVDHRKRKPESDGIPGILETLEKRAKRARIAMDEESEAREINGHPKEPWGPEKSQAKSILDSLEPGQDGVDSEDNGDQSSSAVEKPKQPNTATYNLLTRVLSLTQHYLTSPTPTLRKSLLDLVATVSPALAPDENAFLPLVNAVWPVVISRLHDSEPFVAIAASKALAALCGAAGDFLATRFKTEWDNGLGKWFAKTRAEALKARGAAKAATRKGGPASHHTNNISLLGPSPGPLGVSSDIIIPGLTTGASTGSRDTTSASTKQLFSQSSMMTADSSSIYSTPTTTTTTTSGVVGLGRFSQASQVWEAAVGLLGAIVTYVRIDDNMFDEILDLVADDVLALPQHAAVREALDAVNADAVWLALYARGAVASVPSPMVDGFEFVQMERRVGGVIKSAAVVGVGRG